MIKRKKILLGNKDVISRKIQDFSVDIHLNQTPREFVPNKYDNTFDLLRQYKKERNNCRNFRIYGVIDSPFIDCDNLQIDVLKNEPQIVAGVIDFGNDYIKTVQSKPLISNNWECKNLFNKKKGKFLVELDDYTDSDFVYFYFSDASVFCQNLFKRQLVYRYNTLNIMGERVVDLIPYGSDEAILDIDGNVILVNNDFDFFFNKHWIRDSITMNKIRKTKWIAEEETAFCVQDAFGNYTGWKQYKNLEEIYEDNKLPTGNIKENDVLDESYVSDVYQPGTCPYPGYDPNAIVGNVVELPKIFTLTAGVVNNIGGTIVINPSAYNNEYLEGTVVTITAVEGVGYDFQEFQNAPAGSTNGNILTLTMDSNKAVYANYIPEKRKISILNGSEIINISPLGLLTAGDYNIDYYTELTFVNSSVVVNGIHHGSNYKLRITSDMKINKFFGSIYVTF